MSGQYLCVGLKQLFLWGKDSAMLLTCAMANNSIRIPVRHLILYNTVHNFGFVILSPLSLSCLFVATCRLPFFPLPLYLTIIFVARFPYPLIFRCRVFRLSNYTNAPYRRMMKSTRCVRRKLCNFP